MGLLISAPLLPWRLRVHLLALAPDPHENTQVVPMLDDNYAYIIMDPATHAAAAVDPSDADAVLAAAEAMDARITHVLTTNGHWDHAGGNKRMREALGRDLVIVGSKEDNVSLCSARQGGGAGRVIMR